MFDVTNKTKSKPPRLPFCEIKNFVLGEEYEISLVFIGDIRSRKLNNQYREKDKPTNILTFPLDEASGEIFINLHCAKSEAPKFELSPKNFVGLLFIHGLLHLKGFAHGSTMENEERRIQKKFNL